MSGIIYCSKCSAKGGVVDSRHTAEGLIWRRRKCSQCQQRWTTIEIRREEYDRVKSLLLENNRQNHEQPETIQ